MTFILSEIHVSIHVRPLVFQGENFGTLFSHVAVNF